MDHNRRRQKRGALERMAVRLLEVETLDRGGVDALLGRPAVAAASPA